MVGVRVFEVTDIGVHIIFNPARQAEGLGGLGLPPGAVVWRVEKGPGQTAGLHAGDVIAAINDQKIASEDDLRRVLKGVGPGKSRYVIRRGEQTLVLEIDCPTCTAT
jgi:S1-C subfamily serine protease